MCPKMLFNFGVSITEAVKTYEAAGRITISMVAILDPPS